MLPLRLLRVAFEAECLRQKHHMRRMVGRAVLGSFALALALIAVVFLHAAAWYWLAASMAGQYVALIFAGTDLLAALILVVLVLRSRPGLVEMEALAVRRLALDDAVESLRFSALLVRLMEQMLRSWPRE